MKTLRYIGTCSLSLILFLCLCSGCYAGVVVDKNHVVQISLADKVDGGKTPTVIVVHYSVLAALPEEYSLVQIAMIGRKISLKTGELSKEQKDLINASTLGLISHFPSARQGDTGEVRLPIPLSAQKTVGQHFVLFRMHPAHPEGTLDKSRLEIVSVVLE